MYHVTCKIEEIIEIENEEINLIDKSKEMTRWTEFLHGCSNEDWRLIWAEFMNELDLILISHSTLDWDIHSIELENGRAFIRFGMYDREFYLTLFTDAPIHQS